MTPPPVRNDPLRGSAVKDGRTSGGVTAVLFAVGFVFRALMFFSGKSLWGDEWFSIDLVRKPFLDVFWGSIRDVHPPLYFLLLHGLVRIFGAVEPVFRLPSFLSSVGTLAFLYLAAKETFGKSEARLALFLTAVSPYWLQSAGEIRSYALFAFLVTAATFFLLKSLRDPGRKSWAWGYAVAGVAAVYTEHYAWFWVMASTALLVSVFFGRGEGSSVVRFHRAMLALCLPSLTLIAYQSVYSEHVFQWERIREYWDPAILFKKTAGVFWHFSSGYTYSMLTAERIKHYLIHSPFFWFSGVVTAGSLALSGWAMRDLFQKRREFFKFFFFALFFPVIFLLVFYSIRLDARYLCFAAPFFFILTARGAQQARPWLRHVFLVLYSAVALTGSARAVTSSTDMAHKEDFKGMVAYVLEKGSAGEAVFGPLPQTRYYEAVLKRRFKAAYYPVSELAEKAVPGVFKRVWIMDAFNMNPEVMARQFQTVETTLNQRGYFLTEGPLRFGGPEAITAVYLFQSGKDHGA